MPVFGPASGESGEGRALRRTLTLWEVAASGVGLTLGAGVYVLIGPAAAVAGNALWLGFIVAGVTAGLTAYAYARLGAIRPRNATEFQYTSITFGMRAGFLAGWLSLAAALLATAAVSLGFGNYLQHLTGLPAVLGALLLLAVLTSVLLAGVAQSVALSILFTIIEVSGLLLVMVAGIPFAGRVDYLEMPHGLDGVWAAGGLLLFAYLGFDKLGNLAEEMRHPERDLPRALFLSLATTGIIYLLVALSAVAVAGWRDLSTSPGPLALVVERMLGSSAGTALALIALAATGNTVLLLLVSASRSIYGMAAAGVLPATFQQVGEGGTPGTATFLPVGVVGALLLAGNLTTVAAMTNAAVVLGFCLVNASLLGLTMRAGSNLLPRPNTLDRIAPVLGLASCLWVLWNTGAAAITVAAVLSAMGWLLGGRLSRRPSPGSVPCGATPGRRGDVPALKRGRDAAPNHRRHRGRRE